ncbi:hypothetical protein BDV95DRAFT_486481 [Massariosphaeria phaeospora]|uniref:Six-hairpin glycosidase-like protein n=1 Tax=Massariosphaeria phaeospora TaxID=100035 RepID=A0A7C8IEF7_9PLEO|nr:hypothetical protein BDV95DRAFT_486481 [Massariosphaeria phaeospora]
MDYPEVDIDIAKVATQAKELSSHSWEYGTAAEAILELSNRDLSVYSKTPFPSNGVPTSNVDEVASLQDVKPHIRLDSNTLIEDKWGVADPAALGVSSILIGQSNPAYLHAARRQATYLVHEAPRFGGPHNAISHRKDVLEVWADFMYMVPPFLAYFSVAAEDATWMKEALAQCRAYRDALATKSTGLDQGLWHHIAGPQNGDLGYWCTSNGWVAAGLVRVLATLKGWEETREWAGEMQELRQMAREILDGAICTDSRSREVALLPNYLHSQDAEPWADDVSGTALLASVVYRLAMLEPEVFEGTSERAGMRYLEWAERKRRAVFASVDPETGIAKPAVNPLKHKQREPLTTGSPEGQAFVVGLWAAWRDWRGVV